MRQLDHILSKIQEQEKQLNDIREHQSEYRPNYYKARIAKVIERIGYYAKLLKQFGKQGLIIQITAQGFIKVGESNILSAYILYYNNINKEEAIKLFEYEHSKDMVISIMEITPGKISKINVA